MTSLPERAGHPAGPELQAQRAGLAQAVAAGLWLTQPAATELMLGGVRALRFDPPGPALATVVHFHGGAYRIGCPEQVGPYAAALAAACGVTVICPAYRLAPEHPFPAALNDGLAVLHCITGPLVIAGDSAGGGLAASLTARLVAEGRALAGLVMLSAWLDLTVTSASYADNGLTDPLFSRASAEVAAQLYLQGGSADDPLASPLSGPVAGFPPTLISIGTGEVLAGDAQRLREALAAASVPARFSAIAGMDHVAVTRGLDLPGARETFAEVVTFVDEIVIQSEARFAWPGAALAGFVPRS